MKLHELDAIRPEWRTSTVVELCMGMREAQDFGALPILADALQDAGCPEDHAILTNLRTQGHRYAVASGLVGLVLSPETADAVCALSNESWARGKADPPDYEILVAAAVGRHEENGPRDEGPYRSYYNSRRYDDYLHFGGTDAHGDISPRFWDLVQLATGTKIPKSKQAKYFSCSC